ncbi:MAG TPA: peptide chain release factor 2 [Candidatus Saccharimonadales bacterium]|nr:peptide chain release factor 2 [Candidatus Saccharimonadales bacterium]
MDELLNTAEDLARQIDAAMVKLKIGEAKLKLEELRSASQDQQFWSDNLKAQETMKEISKLETRIAPWLNLQSSLHETIEIIKLKDKSLDNELRTQLDNINETYQALKEDLKYDGPYDVRGAILSIYAGAGGTDAQDWTQMLLRMYSRYFEQNNWEYKLIEESSGDEAGLKSVTLEIDAPYVYGKLKGEHGVHRLVRLSPFNADNLRQTSFAKVEVMPIIDKPDDLEIDEKDLKIDVYRSGGHGGQSVNTTDSAVRITHVPTGIAVAIQNERSQLQNREMAMTILRSRLAQLQLEQHQEKLGELKGPNQSAEWGNQIRSYVLHPYKQVKDLRSRYESSDPDSVLDGNIQPFIEAYLEYSLS